MDELVDGVMGGCVSSEGRDKGSKGEGMTAGWSVRVREG